MDTLDRNILVELAADARLSNRELARRLGVAPGTIAERVDRLERAGTIGGYHARVDPAALGYGTSAIIGLQVAHGAPVRETMEMLAQIEGVTAVTMVTGQWDLMVELHVRDQAHLRDMLTGVIWELPGFQHSETLLALDQIRQVFTAADLP